MDGFYVSLVFLGILLVLFSLICIFLDKKKIFDFTKNYEEKKQQLIEIINDAEQMIDEMNKFSDYIVNRMDLKNDELNKNIQFAEEKLNALSNRVRMIYNKTKETAIGENEVECGLTDMGAVSSEKPEVMNTVTISYPAAAVNGSTAGFENTFIPLRKREKVIPINNKYSEVSRLSQEGMQSLEIARRLNIGKGEVELILGLRK